MYSIPWYSDIGKKLPLHKQTQAKGLFGVLTTNSHQEWVVWGEQMGFRVSFGSGWPQLLCWKLNRFQGGYSKNSESCPSDGPEHWHCVPIQPRPRFLPLARIQVSFSLTHLHQKKRCYESLL